MSTSTAGSSEDAHVYIDLDEPTPWWVVLLLGAVTIVMLAVFLAPWFVRLDEEEDPTVASSTLQSTNSLCQPDSSEVPDFLNPSLGSWSRFCEWFIAPNLDDADTP